MPKPPEEQQWSLDREIVITRVFDAPRELVYEAWANPEHLPKWFGPEGFTLVTQEIAIRPGGKWRFVFTGPDGTTYDNRVVFLEVGAPELLYFDHGRDCDDDPGKFRVTVTFDEQTNKKTVVTLRQLHPSKELREEKIAFGAVELGLQTLDKLAQYLPKL